MNHVAGIPDILGGRFSLLRQLGEGGFGVVYEAEDARFGDRVAVKLLRRDHAKAIYRFKREFRSLADVVHPNLVRLYELVSDDDALYFTMELVDGPDLMSYVCGVPRRVERTITTELHAPAAAVPNNIVATDAEKLRAVFAQLANGVQALHDAHKLHCDIKPSNVLIAQDGRVVLLDFGLIADLDEHARSTFGTPGYMAPEQAISGAISTATDWFGVGAMLHEALTGELPIAGRACRVDRSELQALAELCDALLDPIPDHRPSGREILARLGATTAASGSRAVQLFGREPELATLRAAWAAVREGATIVIRIVGASGIGKTTLAERFLGELRAEPDALVLTGRCFEQESVPYKALDGVIDALADHLGRLEHAAAGLLIPDHGGLLAQLFPVLGHAVRAHGTTEELDSQTARRRGFLALRELLARISSQRPIVCLLDDLQWGDVDSARLFAELVRPPGAPRMLVIASHRPHTTGDGFLSALDEQPLGVRDLRIELGELGAADAHRLASHLLGDRADEVARAIGRESSGNPLFIHQLVAATHERAEHDPRRELGLAEVILSRVDALDRDARLLVQTIALAGRPIDETAAIHAAAIDPSTARAVMFAVRHARLVTARAGDGGVFLEPAHDRVRETVAASLSDRDARKRHLRIAETLLARPDPDPDTLVHHFRSAGDVQRTRVHALVAAERAERALAFDRAAARLALVLELGETTRDDRWQLLERHGNALANAGRSGEAAEAFQAAAEALGQHVPDAPSILTFSRRAAELSLRSGRLAIGTRRMETVLRRVGVTMPRTRRRAAAISVARRLRLFMRGTRFVPRESHDLSADARERLEALWSASSGFSMVNHVLADALGLHHLLESLRIGARSHLVRGFGYEAAFEAVIGGAFLRRRCERLLAQMDELAIGSNDPYDHAWARMSHGITRWFDGDWPTTWRECDAAAAIYRDRCHGVSWELVVCDAYRLPALAYLGELSKLADLIPRAFEAARERGDLFGAATLQFGQHSLVALAADRPADAIEAAQAAIASFPTEIYLLPHYHHLLAFAQAELYRGNPERALGRIDAEWRGLERSRLVRVQCLRLEIRHLRARAALATAAVSPPDRRRELLRTARADAAIIARDPIAPAAPLADAIRAGAANLEGDVDTAATLLAGARDGFDAAHMVLYARAASARLGVLAAGAGGRESLASADRWMAAQGIKNTEAMSAMLVPGV